MKTFDAEATRDLLPYPELAQALQTVLRDKQAGSAVAPPRLIVPIANNGTLLVMPAADENIAITKLVTVHRDNPTRGLPSIQAEVFVMNAHTGERLCVLDGATVTARRTAALSLLAAQWLAPVKTGPMLIVGAGVQGHTHLGAFAVGLGIQEFFIASKTLKNAQALAEVANSSGLKATVIESMAALEAVLPVVSLIATGTTSSTPVIPANVREDAFVAAIGAYNASMAELPPALVQRAQVFVDSLDGAKHEAGDLIQANVDWSRVIALESVNAANAISKTTGPVVFKSVGHALWDLAAARLAVSKL
jgi:1-piperideine-2-carboxylate/1-pyrroline-2-carboxylate reductase [NAD(P)H]